jgi:hypothetical protein
MNNILKHAISTVFLILTYSLLILTPVDAVNELFPQRSSLSNLQIDLVECILLSHMCVVRCGTTHPVCSVWEIQNCRYSQLRHASLMSVQIS